MLFFCRSIRRNNTVAFCLLLVHGANFKSPHDTTNPLDLILKTKERKQFIPLLVMHRIDLSWLGYTHWAM
jgi:hypothetical protein